MHSITPHSRAALVTRTQRVPEPGSHPHDVSRRAEACVTVSDQTTYDELTPFSLPTSRHSRAALALRHRRVRDRRGPIYDSSRPAEACAIPRDASHPPNPARAIQSLFSLRTCCIPFVLYNYIPSQHRLYTVRICSRPLMLMLNLTSSFAQW
ncbi:hypothetical protein EDB89DRAFT_555920 [Lactarius sanguifluus]|nr:hypothetical protein EDB89DRAFT_555920 [Lactarius sanguifluus]